MVVLPWNESRPFGSAVSAGADGGSCGERGGSEPFRRQGPPACGENLSLGSNDFNLDDLGGS